MVTGHSKKSITAENVVIYLSDSPGAESMRWLHGSTVHQGSLQELAATLQESSQSTAIAVIPGQAVTSLAVDIPSRTALRAIPYLVEEQLASPVEELHISYRSLAEKNRIISYAIGKEHLDKYLEQLAEAGIFISAMIADYELLPQKEGYLNCVSIGQNLLVKQPTGEGCALYSEDSNENTASLMLESFASQQQWQVHQEPLTLAELLKRAPDCLAASLLTNEYTPNRNQHTNWRKPALYSAAACMLLFIGYTLTFGWIFNNKAEALYEQSTQLYMELFPDTKRITNLRRQMQGKLSLAGSSNQTNSLFLELLAQASPLLTQNSANQLRQLRFNQDQNSLQLELQSNSMATLNQLQQSLNNNQLTATILSANSNDAGVLARLAVTTEKNQ